MPDTEVTENVEAEASPVAIPDWGSDALDALIGDDYSLEAVEAPGEGGPATEPVVTEPTAEQDEAVEDGTDELSDAAIEASDAPQSLKDLLKGKTRSEKRVIYEHFEGRAGAKLKTAQEAAERAKAEADSRDAAARAVREKQGAYIGEVESKLPDGRKLPTFDVLQSLITDPEGSETLRDEYGLSELDAKYQLAEWKQRREMLDGSAGHFREDAWKDIGRELAAEVAAQGLPVDDVFKGVTGVRSVMANVVSSLKAAHALEIAELNKKHDSRIKAATANGPALAARTAAKTLPTPETGGRSDSSGARTYTTSELSDPKFFRAHEADIDRAYAEGRIVEG